MKSNSVDVLLFKVFHVYVKMNALTLKFFLSEVDFFFFFGFCIYPSLQMGYYSCIQTGWQTNNIDPDESHPVLHCLQRLF